jgi:Domain of unknown function (DUF4331)
MDLRFTRNWLLVTTLAVAGAARAADHADGPAATADPAADITDVFAWMSSDASRVYLVMDVFPNAGPGPTAATGQAAAKFSDVLQYVFHMASYTAFGQAVAATEDIVCTFDAGTPQRVNCWAGDEYVTGDASAAGGIQSATGRLRVFAGLRDDPFFFNLDGFKAVAEAVHGAASTLSFDPAGCPTLDAATSTALVKQLSQGPGGGPPQDHFARNNVLALVLSVDKALVAKGGPVVSVWGSTNRP